MRWSLGGKGISAWEGEQAVADTRVSRLRRRGLEPPRGPRHQWRGSEGQEGFGEGYQVAGVSPRAFLSHTRSWGVFPDWGGAQPHSVDEEMRHGGEKVRAVSLT